MSTNAALVCPLCKQMDATRKVSALVSGGISKTEIRKRGAVFHSLEATNVNQLAQHLLPPPYPTGDGSLVSFGGVISIGLFGFIGYVLGGLVGVVVAGVLGVVGPTVGLLGGGVGIIGIILAVRYLFGLNKEERSSLPRRKRAWHVWNSLFYCSRCDGVFVPGESRFVPVDQMQTFLKE